MNIKKAFTISLAITLVFSLTACSKNTSDTNNNQTSQTETSSLELQFTSENWEDFLILLESDVDALVSYQAEKGPTQHGTATDGELAEESKLNQAITDKITFSEELLSSLSEEDKTTFLEVRSRILAKMA